METIVQRDVRDLSRLNHLDALPRLLQLAAAQTAQLLNISSLAGPFHVSRPTIRDYVTLLAQVFLVEELAPWHSNRVKRLVKTPKLHICDTGVGAALLNHDAESLRTDHKSFGALLETFVLQELQRQASGIPEPIRFSHFRDKDKSEVDVIIEFGADRVVGIEIKAGSTVFGADFRGLRKIADRIGSRFHQGVVLYDGDAALSFGPKLKAVPFPILWD